MSQTIKRLAEETMKMQDACNLLGVSKRFPEAIQELTDELRRLGQPASTADIATHPITRWWVDKLRQLAGEPTTEDYTKVDDWQNGLNLPTDPEAWARK